MINIFKNKFSFLYKLYLKMKYKKLGINCSKIDKKIENISDKDLSSTTIDIVVSLTSYGKRLNEIQYTLYSILKQSHRPKKIILNISKDHFPKTEDELPISLRKLLKFGIEINWTKDIKSFTKLIPTLVKYPNEIIVTADDDIYYHSNWLNLLYVSYLNYPNDIHVHNATKIGKDGSKFNQYIDWRLAKSNTPSAYNFLKGYAGVLYPPHSFYHDVFNEHLFLDLAPTADDIWFWAMVVLNHKSIRVVKNNITTPKYVNIGREFKDTELTLHSTNVAGGANDLQIKAILEYYPQIIEILDNEHSAK